MCLWVDTPAWPVYILATVASLLGTPFRVAQRSIMPSLADRPEELTAANGTSSTIESLSFFVGPALAAVLLGVASRSPLVFMVNVASFVVVDAARRPPQTPQPTPPRAGTEDDAARTRPTCARSPRGSARSRTTGGCA